MLLHKYVSHVIVVIKGLKNEYHDQSHDLPET